MHRPRRMARDSSAARLKIRRGFRCRPAPHPGTHAELFEVAGFRAAVQFVDEKSAMVLLWALSGDISESDIVRILGHADCEPLRWLKRDVWRNRRGASAVMVSRGSIRLRSQTFFQ